MKRTPVASDSSYTSKAYARTPSSNRRFSCSSTSCIAARAAARSIPATALASSSRCRTRSSAKKRAGLASRCLPPVNTAPDASFSPRDPSSRATIEALVERIVHEEGQTLLGWRDLPTDDRLVGASAAAVAPYFKQLFVGASADLKVSTTTDAQGSAGSDVVPTFRSAAFERKLFVIRKRSSTLSTRSRSRARIGNISTFRVCRRTRSSTRAC